MLLHRLRCDELRNTSLQRLRFAACTVAVVAMAQVRYLPTKRL